LAQEIQNFFWRDLPEDLAGFFVDDSNDAVAGVLVNGELES